MADNEIKVKSKRGGARPGAGRPRGTIKAKVNRVRYVVMMDINAAAELEYLAKKYKVSKADVLSVMLTTYEDTSFPAHMAQYQGKDAIKR